MNFESIIGQTEIISGLRNSILNDRIGHAYIFTGPRGIGKKTVARIFAGLLLCKETNAFEPCGHCPSCRLQEVGSNPDYREIDTDGASIGVDDIRSIQGDIVVRPLYSGRKVYLILDAERMTAQAQNCLLKTLEEPPGYAVIILTAANYDALLETIRSRGIRYNFKKNSPEEVRSFLESKYGKNLKELDFISSYSDGIIGTALELADSDEFVRLRERTLDIVLKLVKCGPEVCFEVYDFFEENKAGINLILDIMMLFYRDLLMVKKAAKQNILINSDKKDIIFNNASNFSPHKLVRNIDLIEMTRRNVKQNINYQLSMEVLLMKLRED